MRHVQWKMVAIVVGVVFGVTLRVGAEIPGQKDTGGYTDAKYRSELLKLNLQTTVEAYATAGKRDAAWDKQATAFLEATAKELTYGPCVYFVDYPQVASPPALVALGKAAVDAGCDDPLVLYFYARALLNDFSKEPVEPYLARMAPAMLESKYPALRVCAALGAVVKNCKSPENKELRERCLKALPGLLDAALAKKAVDDLGPIGPRYAVEFMDVPMDILPELEGYEQLLKFTKAGLEKGLHPYVMRCLAGKAYHGMMYGLPNSAEHRGQVIADARRELTQAWKDYAQFPNAPAILVSVVGVTEARDKAETRLWFERATQIQFDYDLAYTNYSMTFRHDYGQLIPEDYREFAEECAQTQRYDTFVPYLYLTLFDKANAALPDEAVQPSDSVAAAICQGYAESYHQPQRLAVVQSYLCALAAFNKKYGEVCKWAEKLGPNVLGRPFDRFGLISSREIQYAYAATSTFADKIADADLFASSSAEDGLDRYTPLVKTIPENDKSRAYVLNRIAELKIEQEFLAGQWVDIQPKADFAGWGRQSGNWTVDKDGGLVGECGAEPLEIYHLSRFGRRFTFAGHVEMIRLPQGIKDAARVGPFLMGSPGFPRFSMMIYKEPAQVALCEFLWAPSRPIARSTFAAPATGNDDFLVQIFNTYAIPTVNGRLVSPRFPITEATLAVPNLIGLGTNHFNDGAIYRFTHLRIRLLDKEPVLPAPKKKP